MGHSQKLAQPRLRGIAAFAAVMSIVVLSEPHATGRGPERTSSRTSRVEEEGQRRQTADRRAEFHPAGRRTEPGAAEARAGRRGAHGDKGFQALQDSRLDNSRISCCTRVAVRRVPGPAVRAAD